MVDTNPMALSAILNIICIITIILQGNILFKDNESIRIPVSVALLIMSIFPAIWSWRKQDNNVGKAVTVVWAILVIFAAAILIVLDTMNLYKSDDKTCDAFRMNLFKRKYRRSKTDKNKWAGQFDSTSVYQILYTIGGIIILITIFRGEKASKTSEVAMNGFWVFLGYFGLGILIQTALWFILQGLYIPINQKDEREWTWGKEWSWRFPEFFDYLDQTIQNNTVKRDDWWKFLGWFRLSILLAISIYIVWIKKIWKGVTKLKTFNTFGGILLTWFIFLVFLIVLFVFNDGCVLTRFRNEDVSKEKAKGGGSNLLQKGKIIIEPLACRSTNQFGILFNIFILSVWLFFVGIK